MTDRTAIDTIKGYFYQFDYSISSILQLKAENDSIVVEGVEDIDITTATNETAVQCKYYAKTEYNHSVISEPIRQMLSHFASARMGPKKNLHYKLRGYFKSGQSKLILPLSIDLLKKQFLTYTHNGIKYEHHHVLGLSDVDLTAFISRLDIDIHAKEFDAQFIDVIKDLKATFKCSKFSSEFFYYNNALRVIKDMSIKATEIERTITKKSFLQRINTSKILFNEWFIKLKGESLHFQMLKKEYFTSLNVSPFERFFLIEIDPANYNRSELKELLLIIAKKWAKLTKRDPKPFCPYIYLHQLNSHELIALKKEMISEGHLLLDGFDFEGAEFNPVSIIRKADHYNQVKLKVINSLDHLEPTLSAISKTREVYQFFLTEPFFKVNNPSIKTVAIQVEKTNSIKQII